MTSRDQSDNRSFELACYAIKTSQSLKSMILIEDRSRENEEENLDGYGLIF